MLISKYFRFSGRHIGYLECVKYGLKAPSCSQFLFRKCRRGASINSKRFGNGCKNSCLGWSHPTPLTIRTYGWSPVELFSFAIFLRFAGFLHCLFAFVVSSRTRYFAMQLKNRSIISCLTLTSWPFVLKLSRPLWSLSEWSSPTRSDRVGDDHSDRLQSRSMTV